MDTEYALDLGRPVLVGDIAAVHPGRPERCLCHGSAEIPFIGERRPGENICGIALDAFRKKCGQRVVDTPRGPRWKRGETPEEWGFVQIFAAEVGELRRQEDFRRKHPEWRREL